MFVTGTDQKLLDAEHANQDQGLVFALEKGQIAFHYLFFFSPGPFEEIHLFSTAVPK